MFRSVSVSLALRCGVLSLLLVGCKKEIPAVDPAVLANAREGAKQLSTELSQALKTALSSSGPAAAIGVCKQQAPGFARAVSERTGQTVRRVSAKQRNPAATPDEWETRALATLENLRKAGKKPDEIETFEVTKTEKGFAFRYAKGLLIQPVCLTCHGSKETLSEEVRGKLSSDYPSDQAVGYSVGDLRGAISVEKKL